MVKHDFNRRGVMVIVFSDFSAMYCTGLSQGNDNNVCENGILFGSRLRW